MRPFITPDRKQISLMPPSIEEWLPENHLARFVVDIADQLNLSAIYKEYGKSGSTPYDPRMLVTLLFYGYATGVFSSRKLEQATYDSVAFRFISGSFHPDHDTINAFRKRFLPELAKLFVEILLLAKEIGLVKIGKVNIDGTKVQANASKHKAMSYGHMEKLEKQLKAEVAQLMKMAESADELEDKELDIPEELQRRESRLQKLKEAKATLKCRAKERYKKEKAEHDEKMKQRQEKEKATGKKIGGKKPKPPEPGPTSKDQINFTDPESRIMKGPKAFEQCYNGQAAVNDDMLIVGAYATSHVNDKQELLPALDAIAEELGTVTCATADTGYFSEENVKGCEQRKVDPFVAIGRQGHNQFLDHVLNSTGENGGIEAKTVKEKMEKKLKSKEGKDVYRTRKMTVEPVFGIIKEIMGFRRFSLRGEEQANGEWLLVCGAYNLKRLFNMNMGMA